MHLHRNILKQKLQSRSAFTLIEVMIAMAILAVMSVLIFTSTSQTMDGTRIAEQRDELNHSASLFLGRMSADLQMAFLLGQDFLPNDGKIKTVFVGDEAEIHFPSFAHYRYYKNVPEADFGEIGYSVQNDPEDTQKKVLVRRESAVLDDNPQEGGKSEILVEGVRELNLEYYDPLKKEWLKSWDSTQLENLGKLPRAVKIQLKLQEADGEEELIYQTIAEIKLHRGVLSF